jgi:hypothetical protein
MLCHGVFFCYSFLFVLICLLLCLWIHLVPFAQAVDESLYKSLLWMLENDVSPMEVILSPFFDFAFTSPDVFHVNVLTYGPMCNAG